MKSSSIAKMMKANELGLNPRYLEMGLERFALSRDKLGIRVYECELAGEDLFHCRVHFEVAGRHRVLSRIGVSEDEARAKIGLAMPLKRLLSGGVEEEG